jgi:hypothetical protein
MDDAGRLVLVEYLQQLRPSVGFECLPRVVGKTKWVAQPGRIADLDHPMRELGAARDLPKPTVRVAAGACVPSEVGADLPARVHRRRAGRRAAVGELPTPRVVR